MYPPGNSDVDRARSSASDRSSSTPRRRFIRKRQPTEIYAPGSGGKAFASATWDYQAAARYLKTHRNELMPAFSRPHHHPAGCLFHFCSPDRRSHWLYEHQLSIGCPIQIASCTHYVAWGRECTSQILRLGLPTSADELTNSQLDELVDLQIEMDLTFRTRKWREDFPLAMVATWPSDRTVDEDEDEEWF